MVNNCAAQHTMVSLSSWKTNMHFTMFQYHCLTSLLQLHFFCYRDDDQDYDGNHSDSGDIGDLIELSPVHDGKCKNINNACHT